MGVDADPDAVNNVKRLVQALIAAGEGERVKHTQDRDTKQGTFDTAKADLAVCTLAHTTAAGELSDGRDEVQRLTGVKATAKTAKDEAKVAYDEAVSKFNQAAANLVDETNRVDTEKATLEEIRRLLNTLLPAEEDGYIALNNDNWNGNAVFDTETSINRGNWIESRVSYNRPLTVNAEMKADNAECITLSLFAPNHGKNTAYSLETGGWSNRVRIFPGDFRKTVGRNAEWHSVKIVAKSDGDVSYYYKDQLMTTVQDDTKQSGTVQFIAGCVGMKVRNVKIESGEG